MFSSSSPQPAATGKGTRSGNNNGTSGDASGSGMFITGYSLRAPSSHNPKEFFDNLVTQTDMVTPTRRYPEGYHGLPPRTGTLPDISSFDHEFFKLNRKQTDKMEPLLRQLLETTQEALMDAKLPIAELRGSNTGVYVGNMYTDFCRRAARDPTLTGYEAVNGAQNMLANRLSFHYDFKGPSVVMDTACSSSFVALHQARMDILAGIIDRAVVAGTSITSDPNINMTLKAYTMLSPTGTCHSFDDKADGYCRSEGVFVIVLESARVSRAGYATLLASSVNSDGYTAKGITFPSGKAQASNMRGALRRAGIEPESISYIEAHGTGTTAGDNQELQGMSALFYGDNHDPTAPAGAAKHRRIPIGSVKSCMGHAEGASGMASLAKCLLMMEHRRFLPNQHFESTSHAALLDGRFEVVTGAGPWTPGNVCISNYGFGGTNAFAVLGPGNLHFEHPTSEVEGKGDDERGSRGVGVFSFGNASGGPQAGPGGAPNVAPGWLRDQVLLGNDAAFKYRNGKKVAAAPRVAFVYGGQGSQWLHMGRRLYESSRGFRGTIDRLGEHLREFDPAFDLADLFQRGTEWMRKELTVIGVTAYQIASTNILRDELGLVPDFVIGHSLGETAAGYAHGHQTERETISIAWVRGRLSGKLAAGGARLLRTTAAHDDLRLAGTSGGANYYAVPTAAEAEARCDEAAGDQCFDLDGRMAAVGLEAEAVEAAIARLGLRETVLACFNSPKGQTVSGAAREVAALKADLLARHPDLFWRDVNTDGVAYHAPHLQAHYDALVAEFEAILGPERRPFDPRWLSTSAPGRATPAFLDAHYHARNITGPVHFTRAVQALPPHTLVVEVGSSQSMLGQVKRTRRDVATLGLVKVKDAASEDFYLDTERTREALWEAGFTEAFRNAATAAGADDAANDGHASVDRAVDRGARLALALRYPDLWNHSVQHRIFTWEDFEVPETAGSAYGLPSSSSSSAGAGAAGDGGVAVTYDVAGDDAFLLDHQISGRKLFPATGHVWTMWQALRGANAGGGVGGGLELLDFEILQAVVLDPVGCPVLEFRVQSCEQTVCVLSDGLPVARARFELLPAAAPAAAPRVNVVVGADALAAAEAAGGAAGALGAAEMYNQFRRYGYEYGPEFRLMAKRTLAGRSKDGSAAAALLRPARHLIPFLDNLLQVSFIEQVDALVLPTRVRQLRLFPAAFTEWGEAQCGGGVPVAVDCATRTVATAGVLLRGLELSAAAPRPGHELVHEAMEFLELGWAAREDRPDAEHEAVLSATCVLAAGRFAAHFAAHPELLAAKPWLAKLQAAAQKYQPSPSSPPLPTAAPAAGDMDPVALREWITYRLVDDLTAPGAPLEAFLANPLFALSTHPEHEEFYTANPLASCDRATLARVVGLVRNEVGGHGGVRVLEVGAGACGFAARARPLLREVLGTYTCTDAHAVHLPAELAADSRFATTLQHDVDDALPEELRTQDVIVASHALYLARDVRASLRLLIRKLRVGGLVVLEEFTGDQGVLMWGADEHFVWDRAADTATRSDGLWMTPEEWHAAVGDVAGLEVLFAQTRPGNLTMVLRRTAAGGHSSSNNDDDDDNNNNAVVATVAAAPAGAGGAGLRIATLRRAAPGAPGAGEAQEDVDDPARTPARRSAPAGDAGAAAAVGAKAVQVVHTWEAVDLARPQLLVGDGAHAFRRCLEQEDDVAHLQVLCTDGSLGGADVAAAAALAAPPGLRGLRYLTVDGERLGTTVCVPLDCATAATAAAATTAAGRADVAHGVSLAIGKPGDLSTLQWQRADFAAGERAGSATGGTEDAVAVEVEFAAVNPLDVAVCFGRRRVPGYALGMEYAGRGAAAAGSSRDAGEPRPLEFGVAPLGGSLATHAAAGGDGHSDSSAAPMRWMAPAGVSAQEAAGLPVAYLTAAYALFEQARLGAGDTVLVHHPAAAAGVSGVGHAAVRLAQRRGLTVMATTAAATPEERAALELLGLAPENIFDGSAGDDADAACVRDAVLQRTGGLGVDCVLFSPAPGAAGAKQALLLEASLECVAAGGHLCDVSATTAGISAGLAAAPGAAKHLAGAGAGGRSVAFHTFDLRTAAATPNRRRRRRLQALMQGMLDDGEAAPLPLRTCSPGEAAAVLKRLHNDAVDDGDAGGGKLLVHIGAGFGGSCSGADAAAGVEAGAAAATAAPKLARRFRARGVHVVTGGLGGFGLELAHWLLEQGARRVVLTSRSGVRTAWQRLRFDALARRYGEGAAVISHLDVTDPVQARALLLAGAGGDDRVRGVWHSAVVLRDGLFEKAAPGDWAATLQSKIGALENLHAAAVSAASPAPRPGAAAAPLDAFVVFSSVTSMGGNCGQTAYGWANNACERLMERRRRAGLPGVAIQWGAIESAGLAMERGGDVIHMGRGIDVAMQNIDDSLDSLHAMLTACTDSAAVASYRVYVEPKAAGGGDGGAAAPSQAVETVDAVLAKLAEILGGSASDYDATQPLQEYGLDSLSVVEVMNWINRLVAVKVTPSFVSGSMTCNNIFQYISENRA